MISTPVSVPLSPSMMKELRVPLCFLGRSRKNIRKTIILFYKLDNFEVWGKMFHNTKMAQLTKEIEEAVKKLLDLFPELSSINVFFSKFTYSF